MVSQLPDNDRDKSLARSMNEWTGRGDRAEAEKSDPLAGILRIYRVIEQESRRNLNRPSPDNWKYISEAINNSRDVKTPDIGSATTWKIWLSAAAVVLICFTGIFIFFTSRSTSLLLKTTNSKQVYVTADGSRITLRPHSAIYLIKSSVNDRIYRLKGEALFDVVHNPARDFRVRSGNGEVSVLGTRFDLSNWGGKVQVYLERGRVAFKDLKTSQRVILNPGEASSIDREGHLSKPSSQKSDQYLDWLSDYLTFNHQTVRHVFNELEQQYQITIITDSTDASVLNETVSGQIHLNPDLQRTLSDISLVIGGKFIKENNREYRFLPNSR